MSYQIQYPGNLDWLVPNTILYCIQGSRAYGTSRPDSDFDYKGIAVPPRRYREGFLHRFEQAIWAEPEDVTIFDIQKFFALAADANPNILDILFCSPEDRLLCTPAGDLLLKHRDAFLSRKVLYTYRGYAISQLKRIRTHKAWLLNPPSHQPTRAEFNLPDRTLIPADQLAAAMAEVKRKMDSWEIDFGDLSDSTKIHIREQIDSYLTDLIVGSDEKFKVAARLIGYDENFIALLEREKHYKAASNNWQQYQDWKSNRNVVRADLEAKFGYDVKHGSHLVRLMRLCREILVEGVVRVRRPDAEELRAIRDGSWSYDKLIGWAEEQDVELVEVAKTSPLPHSPNRVFLDNLCQEIVRLVQEN
jgi:hypothetical protein